MIQSKDYYDRRYMIPVRLLSKFENDNSHLAYTVGSASCPAPLFNETLDAFDKKWGEYCIED